MSDVVTKTLASVESVEDAEHPNGAFEVIISDDSEDRDGEVIAKGAFEPLPDHLSADVDHGMSVVTTVGSGAPYTHEDGTVRVKGTFASTELGQATRTLVREGHIRTASVAFIRKTVTKSASTGSKVVTKGELLNFAFTPVPSNRNATVLSAKSFAAVDDAREQLRGETARPATKSIVGSVEALQDRVREALAAVYARDGYGYWSGWVRGVLPSGDGGGTVVFDADASAVLADSRTYRHTTFSQAFTDDGKLVTLVGDATEVDLAEVVLPDAEAARVDATKTLSDPPPATAAPSSAASAPGLPASVPDDDQDALRVRATGLSLRALAAG